MASIDPGKLRKRFFTALVVAPPALFICYYGSWPFMLWMLVCFILAQIEWIALSKKLGFSRYYLPGTAYLAFCFLAFLMIGLGKNMDAILLIILIAASDIGAYFSGKIIGGPKMAAKISPNKTMAGLAGAVLMPALVWMGYEFFNGIAVQNLPLYFLFGALIGLSGQVGDVLVSLMKRKANVKDTGNILPGHGGLLDRIDSLMLAAPVFIALEYLIGNI